MLRSKSIPGNTLFYPIVLDNWLNWYALCKTAKKIYMTANYRLENDMT